MDNSKLVKKYLNKYFREQYINETDIEFKVLVRIFNKKDKQNKEILVSRNTNPESLRGTRPDDLNPGFRLIGNLPPDFDPKEFKRLWEAGIPKSSNIKGIPMIFGTGCEQQIGG